MSDTSFCFAIVALLLCIPVILFEYIIAYEEDEDDDIDERDDYEAYCQRRERSRRRVRAIQRKRIFK